MAPHSLNFALLLTRTHRAPFKSSKVYLEWGAIWVRQYTGGGIGAEDVSRLLRIQLSYCMLCIIHKLILVGLGMVS
jgi:hypothetical protein